jgi:hypothetical protein
MAMKSQVEVFWVMMLYSVAVGYQHFRELCYLYLHNTDNFDLKVIACLQVQSTDWDITSQVTCCSLH